MKVIEHDYETILPRGQKAAPFAESKHLSVTKTIEHQSGFGQLMEGSRINGNVRQLLGRNSMFITSAAHRFVGDTR